MGRPEHDDRRLFELLTLEGAQAGLSWTTILRKREGYRAAFPGFDPEVVASHDDDDVDRLLTDATIVRNRGKIESAAKTPGGPGGAARVRQLRSRTSGHSLTAPIVSIDDDLGQLPRTTRNPLP